ncbi:MAG: CDP-diacylglycerol--glycerol-3-phosphate 3-phosphatidyltransferase [Planctomycetaceae bacterium]|jgi:CDP-diacylglycerol--glycerol-3-phosphate 3-phosphatidyltransferase|nr:CDP-diacylglycerol--glycerol-3-phosphate 3-phosphatidyltransferase [Planctomycetaceae bacterium]
MNVPNILTVLRVFFAIATFYFIAYRNFDFALLFFLLASLTDFFDGWWARRFHQITVFGRIMDPFADKFLICGVLIFLVTIPDLTGTSDKVRGWSWFMLQPWMVVVIVGRELLVTSLRAVIESSGGDFSAKWIGKVKMWFQCVALSCCFLFLAGGAELAHNYGDSIAAVSDFHNIKNTYQSSIIADSLDKSLSNTPLENNAKYWRNAIFFIMNISLWITVIVTIYSGITYCYNATKIIRRSK